MKPLYCLFFLAFLLAAGSGFCQSQSSSSAAASQEESLGERPGGGVIIGGTNASQYRSFIVPELFAAVRAGNIEMEAMSRLAYDPVAYPVREKLNPGENPNEFLAEVKKALFNLRIIDGDFDLYSIREDKLSEQYRGSLLRVYGSPDEKKAPLFREKVRIAAPQAISGFAWLTFRLFGPDEDYLWIYSPALKKSRQLTGANRSDGLLRTAFTLDDFFTWSGKVELVDGEQVSHFNALVPFPEVQLSPGAVRNHCVEVRQRQGGEGEGHVLGWNFSSRRFPQAAAWIPTDVIFVPRDLIRLELKSRDPYSLYGRQILYIDAQRMLPIYKFVFDRLGHPWKTVISAFGEVLSADQAGHQPYNSFTVVDDALSGSAYIANFTRFANCSALPEQMALGDFDPRRLGVEPPAMSPAEQPSLSLPVTTSSQTGDGTSSAPTLPQDAERPDDPMPR